MSRAHDLKTLVLETTDEAEAMDAIAELVRLADDAERLREIVREATYIVDGRVDHLYGGECPDSTEGSELRDADCPACQWLAIAARALEAAA